MQREKENDQSKLSFKVPQRDRIKAEINHTTYHIHAYPSHTVFMALDLQHRGNLYLE